MAFSKTMPPMENQPEQKQNSTFITAVNFASVILLTPSAQRE